MSERDDAKEKYTYLSERTKHWDSWLEIGVIVVVMAFALFCAAYSVDGFWIGLWNALKQM